MCLSWLDYPGEIADGVKSWANTLKCSTNGKGVALFRIVTGEMDPGLPLAIQRVHLGNLVAE